MNYIIQTKQLSKAFKEKKALSHFDFNLEKGEICAIIGRNGAGKSTLFKLLSGQLNPSAGEIYLFDQGIKSKQHMRKRFGFMIEAPTFFPDFTAAQNLEYFRIQRGIVEKDKVQEVLKTVELIKAPQTKFKNFSMGMKQRLGIALCLLGSPDCLVLDEPTNGLDAEGIKDIRSLLLKLNQEKQITILISSHILSELQLVANRFVFIQDGILVEDLSKVALHEKSKRKLKLVVDAPHKVARILEETYTDIDYQVLPGSEIILYNHVDESGEINRLLIQHDVLVMESTIESVDLEAYFLDLVGGEAHA